MATFTEDSITELLVLNEGFLQVKRIDRVLRDGTVISAVPHLQMLAPGDDISEQQDRVAAVANVIWTPDVVKEHRAKVALSLEAVLSSVAVERD